MKRKNQYIYRNIVERQKKHMNDDKIIELMNKEVNIIIDWDENTLNTFQFECTLYMYKAKAYKCHVSIVLTSYMFEFKTTFYFILDLLFQNKRSRKKNLKARTPSKWTYPDTERQNSDIDGWFGA